MNLTAIQIFVYVVSHKDKFLQRHQASGLLASTICEILSEEGAVAKWLVHWTTDSGIRVRVVSGGIALRLWLKHGILTCVMLYLVLGSN